MKNILKELERVEKLIVSDPDFHINQKYKSDMEWWVLGKAGEILSELGFEYPTYAIKGESPDFITYNERQMEFYPIEVTEVLEPDRRRAEEYKIGRQITDWSKTPGRLVDPLEKPWLTLEACFLKKFKKKYPPKTWLIIYFNISYSHISEYGWWHKTLLANAKKWDLSGCPFWKVLLLNSSGEALVDLFPKIYVIKPEK